MISLRKRFTRGMVLAALVTGALGATTLPSGSAQAATSKMWTTTYAKGYRQPLSGIKVSGYDNKKILAVISLSSGAKGTLNISNNSFLTLSYGYTKFSGSELSFTAASQDQMNAALGSLTYTSPTDDANTITLSTMFAEAKDNIAYFPVNRHFYEVVRYSAIPGNYQSTAEQRATRNFAVAETAAKAAKQFGLTGYIANVSSKAENDFLSAKLAGAQNVWIGGGDGATEGTWVYTDGPDKGKQFWSGNCSDVDGKAVTDAFAQWAPKEPNNWISMKGRNDNIPNNFCGGDAYNPAAAEGEDCMVTNWSESGTGYEYGYWNDVPCDVTTSTYTAQLLQGYVIEYGNAVDSATYSSGVDFDSYRLVAITPPQTVQPTLAQIVDGAVKKIATISKLLVSKKKTISPAERRRRAAAAKQAERENGAIKFAQGPVRMKKTKCGSWPVVNFSIKVGEKIKPGDEYSIYFTDPITFKTRYHSACSTIQGQEIGRERTITRVRDLKPGQKIVMSMLVQGWPGAKARLNLIYADRQPDGTFKLSRSALEPKDYIVFK